MAIGRNPDEPPEADPAKDQAAKTAGLKRIQIVCDTPDDQPDDPDTPPISFFLTVPDFGAAGEILGEYRVAPAGPAEGKAVGRQGFARISQFSARLPEGRDRAPQNPGRSGFFAYTDFIPRKSEIIVLQDGKRVRVKDIYYRIGVLGKVRLTALIPVVYATLEEADDPQPEEGAK